jgi:hypothetical protein
MDHLTARSLVAEIEVGLNQLAYGAEGAFTIWNRRRHHQYIGEGTPA